MTGQTVLMNFPAVAEPGSLRFHGRSLQQEGHLRQSAPCLSWPRSPSPVSSLCSFTCRHDHPFDRSVSENESSQHYHPLFYWVIFWPELSARGCWPVAQWCRHNQGDIAGAAGSSSTVELSFGRLAISCAIRTYTKPMGNVLILSILLCCLLHFSGTSICEAVQWPTLGNFPTWKK